MKYIKLSKLGYSFYILPAISIEWDKYYEGGYAFIDLEIKWLRWAVGVEVWEDGKGGR